MAKELVSDELWKTIEPLLPDEPPKPKGGRPRVDNRSALAGIIFVLKSGIPWEMLPKEMGCGSGVTCWRRLREWQEAGVWERLHKILLDRLGEADRIDWERASLDSASILVKRGARKPARIQQIRESGLEAPPCFGPKGHPAGGDDERGQRTRLDGLRGARGRHRAHKAPSWQAEEAPEEAARRQSLRRQEVQADSEEARHQEPDSKEGDREQREAGTTQVGGGEDTGLACEVPQSHDPLRAAGRHP